MAKLVIKHDLSKLTAEELEQYKRDVSEFIGLDPDLNGLDTIYMPNESGQGQALVLYARRGTAEILREINGIEIDSLTNTEVRGSIVFTATGHNKQKRHEIATGSKYIANVNGKQLDDAIMTASTRALRRLTMQFTKLGILDQSEVESVVGSAVNPAAGATLSGSAVVIPPPQVAPNNAPGKDVTPPAEPFVGQQDQIDAAMKQVTDKAAKIVDTKPDPAPATLVESVTSPETEPAKKVVKSRARRPKNAVVMDVEPETVLSPTAITEVVQSIMTSDSAPTPVPPPAAPVAPQADSAAPVQANPVDFEGKPTAEQMAEFRKKVMVYTSELPSSENLGSVQKMRAFITELSGTAPQFMTVKQWQDQIEWFETFVEKHQVKGLVLYINDFLGVK
jgi:hypothetical protein